MPAKLLDNPLVVSVLGRLMEQPAHPYQLLTELRSRSEHYASAVNRGTLYNVVSAVVEQGWAVEEGQQRSGNRPERTVYALTPAGSAELVRRLDHEIRHPARGFTGFLGAIAYLGALGPDGALDALSERIERLRERSEEDGRLLAEVHAEGVPRLYVIEAEYALAQDRSEIAWLESIRAEIAEGTLSWPGHEEVSD
ncbi:PadR family transcriptional regulator [Nocardia panacis]|uniref:PadR family transcriptional regulator n=1 Tax=Nocardia panacis TaxID=2340916 RepID=A0A3A4K7C1_9NOCA|nr:PadR family transcriptional regulator [Nocardia panacis]RJO73402.1 PadR family transcriptional regulator [Nocardia panacis]